MSIYTIGHHVAPLIGLVTLLIGVFAVARPEFMSGKFGIQASGPTLPYIVATGIRDVFMGLTVLALYYLGEFQALGLIMLCLAVVAISDFFNVRSNGDKKTSLVHLAGAVAVAVYGSWILLSITT